jgi:hypothetical protein
MSRILRRGFVWLAFLSILSLIPVRAQQTPPAASAPVPQGILAAKKIFVSNAGADSGLFPSPCSGNPDRGYNQFYADLQAWGRYETVSDPQAADLVFELQLTGPGGPSNANKQKGASDPWPMFRLVIFDRKTHYILWTFTESIAPAILQRSHDKNFDDALAALNSDLRRLAGQTSAAVR